MAPIWFPAIRHSVDDGTREWFLNLRLGVWGERVASQQDIKEEGI